MLTSGAYRRGPRGQNPTSLQHLSITLAAFERYILFGDLYSVSWDLGEHAWEFCFLFFFSFSMPFLVYMNQP